MDYGQLVVELVGDYSKLKTSLSQAKQEAIKQAEELERIYKLSPSLDTAQLKRDVAALGTESGRSLAQSLQQSLNAQKITLSNVTIDTKSLRKVGVEVGRGLAEGIRQGNSQARKAANDLAGITIDETKRKLRIKSPSGVFRDIGEDIVKGLAAGLATGSTLAVGSLIDGVISTAKAVVDKTFDFTGDSINKYASQKAVTAQLAIQLGSQKDAIESLKFVREESDRLGISLENSQSQFAKLIANAKGSKLSLDELKEVYSAFNTLGRINQLSNDDLKGVFVGLEQTFSKGRIQAEELRGQIAERLPGALAIVSKALGVTQAQLDKLLVSGQLKPDQVWLLFAREVQKEYGGKLGEALNNSTVGFTRLANTIYELQTSLGQAIEPAVVTGLTFVTDVIKELGTAGIFYDLNAGANQFSEYLKQNPHLAKETADIISNALKSALEYAVTLSGDLLKYLKENPNAIADATAGIVKFGEGIGQAVGLAKDLLGIFVQIGETVDSFYDKLSKVFGGTPEQQEQFKQFLRFGPISLIPGFPGGANSGDSNASGGLVGGILQGITGQAQTAASSGIAGAIQIINNPNKAHHRGGRAYSAGNDGQTYRGGLLVKDLVFAGGTDAPIPAPVGGIVKLRTDDPKGYGNYADIVNAQGQLLARLGHLSKFADGLQSGQVVQPGQILGNQGSTGRSSGNHLHIELPRELWADYVQALKTGNYSTLPSGSNVGGIAGLASGAASTIASQMPPFPGSTTASPAPKARHNASGSGKYAHTQDKLTPEFLKKTAEVARNLGTSPENLLAVMGFETGGTYSPSIQNSLGMTGLIQFHPKYAPGNVGKSTAQLKQMTAVEQLTYVERYINKNRNGKDVSSLEDLYMSVLMPSMIGKGANASLPQWAYRSNRGLDINRDGQISVGEATAKARDYYRPATNAGVPDSSGAIEFSAPGAIGQTPANIAAILAQQAEQDKINRRNAVRQSQDISRSNSKIISDAEYGANLSPNADQRNARAAQEKLRQLDDQILGIERQYEDTYSRASVSQNKISSGSLDADALAETKHSLELDLNLLQQLRDSHGKLLEIRKNTAAEYQKFNDRDRKFRTQASDLKLDNQALDVTEKRIANIRELQNLNPYAKELANLPQLERKLALQREDLKLKERIQAIEQAYAKGEIDAIEYSVSLDNLEKLNAEEVGSIDLKYRNAEATERQRQANLELSKVLLELQDISDDLNLQAQLKQYGIGSGDRLELERNAAMVDNQARSLQDAQKLSERARLEQFTPEQYAGERIRQAIRDNQRRSLINAQYDRGISDRDFNSGSKVSESLQNLLTAQVEQRQGLGLDAKPLRKQSAILGQQLDFRTQVRDLERLKETGDITADAFDVIRENLEAVNRIKLDTISNEFNEFTGAIKGVKSDTTNVFRDFILGTEDFGSSISKIFQSILNNLANMASQMLSDQLFGSLFGIFGGVGSGGGILNMNSLAGDANGMFGGLFSNGGMVPNYASGGLIGSIADAMAKERLQSGRQPHLIVANDGERVLTPEETQQYNRILSSGQLKNYASGGEIGANSGNSRIAIANSNDGINAPVTVTINGGDSGSINVPLFQKIMESKIQAVIKDERRPGGSLSRGELYGR